jgi:uncharacterized membrane protein YcaP (DUF421 family)
MDFLQRILVGDAPWAFLAEVVVRAIAVYAMLLISMRLMGKRVAAQLSITELAVILMLGAAIGVPIQVSSQGILPALVVLLVVVTLQRGVSSLSVRYRSVEVLAQGDVGILLKDGRILLDGLRGSRISREMLESELRACGVQQLGELRRVYIESSGQLSLVPLREASPGLTICPDADEELRELVRASGYFACWHCGHVECQELKPDRNCRHCGTNRWESAVTRMDL